MQGEIWSEVATGIGRGFSETPPCETEAASLFGADKPLRLFLNFLIGVGLAMGIIYRYRGFTTAVMTHALGNWLVVMILLGR